jgi:hypothetical protein
MFDGPLECYTCMKLENQIDNIRYWYETLLGQLYSDESLFIESLEYVLEQLGAYVGAKIPDRDINVSRSNVIDLKAWKEYNLTYLQSLTTNK